MIDHKKKGNAKKTRIKTAVGMELGVADWGAKKGRD